METEKEHHFINRVNITCVNIFWSKDTVLIIKCPAAAFIKNLNIYALGGAEVKSCLRAEM